MTSDVSNPGFDLFDSNSDDESDSNHGDIVIPSSDTEEDPEEDPNIPILNNVASVPTIISLHRINEAFNSHSCHLIR